MRNLSTFFYFINKIKRDGEATLEKLDNVVDNSFNEMELEPSERCVKNILDFARSYEVFESQETGYIEMNLN